MAQTDNTRPERGIGPWRTEAALIGLAAVAVVAWQLIFPGYYHINDDDAAIIQKYVPQVAESFRHGVLLPKWMPQDFGGYGAPVFMYYSPLTYYLCALLSLTGLGLPLCIAALKLAGLATGGVFIFLLARDSLGNRAALAAALCYILLPTRLLDTYYLNTPAGRMSQAWMPMLLYFIRKAGDGRFRQTYIAGTAISYAGLILTHLASAFLFTPFALTYALFGTREMSRSAVAARTGLGLAAGLLLASFYFLPVLTGRGLVHIEYMGGTVMYPGNFLFYVFGRPEHGAEPLWFIQANVILLELGFAALMYYMLRRAPGMRLSPGTGFYLACIAVCVFLMSSASEPLWKYLPGLSTVQFPYRFTPVYLLFLSALAGTLVKAYMEWTNRPSGVVLTAAALAILVLAYDLSLVVKSSAYSAERADAISRKVVLPEYLPAGVDMSLIGRLVEDGPRLSSAAAYTAEISRWYAEQREFTVYSPDGALLRVRTFFYPGWSALVDGVVTAISVENGSGAMLIDLPAGRHDVELRFTDTWPRTFGKIISLLTLVLLLLPYDKLRGAMRQAL